MNILTEIIEDDEFSCSIDKEYEEMINKIDWNQFRVDLRNELKGKNR